MILSEAEFIIDTRKKEVQHILLDRTEPWDETRFNPWQFEKFEAEKISYLWFLKLKPGWAQRSDGTIQEVKK